MNNIGMIFCAIVVGGVGIVVRRHQKRNKKRLELLLKSYKTLLEGKEEEVRGLKRDIELEERRSEKVVQKLNDEVDHWKRVVDEKESTINDLKSELKTKEKLITEYLDLINEKDSIIKKCKKTIKRKDSLTVLLNSEFISSAKKNS
jgi:hypothetical protein